MRDDASLLLALLLALACGFGVLILEGRSGVNAGTAALAAGAFLFAGAVQSFYRRGCKPEKGACGLALPFAMFFSSVGLLMVARLKPSLLYAQICWLFAGLCVFAGVCFFWRRLARLLEYPYIAGLFCAGLLVLPLLFGAEIGGSRNWLSFGGVSVQPSEFSKILLLFFLASYLADHEAVLTENLRAVGPLRLPPFRFIAPLLLIWTLSALLFVVARDLGSALLFFSVTVAMAYMATGSRSYTALAFVFFAAAAGVSWVFFSHVRVRVAVWLDPWLDPSGRAYQVVQSLFAFGAGGVWGAGFAHGAPGLIPEVHTDFVLAAVAEELGFLGVAALLLGYMLFFFYSLWIALRLRAAKKSLLASGCGLSLAMQAFIIAAGVTKLLPLTGITLPFVSYGGSSMASVFFLTGILAMLEQEADADV